MGRVTGIGWTDATFNFWWGCTKVSDACKLCYIGPIMKRAGRIPFGGPIRTVIGNWKQPAKWQREAVEAGLRLKVFSCSMSDFFHAGADRWRAEAWEIIRATPNLDWQILTKRHERIADHLPKDWGNGWPNVWLGVTCENQDYMHRVDTLLTIPAAVRFVSAEPLLGPLNFGNRLGVNKVTWVIDGCEQAGKEVRRAMNDNHCRSIRDQCQASNVAYFHKQYYEGNTITTDGNLDGNKYHELPTAKRATRPVMNREVRAAAKQPVPAKRPGYPKGYSKFAPFYNFAVQELIKQPRMRIVDFEQMIYDEFKSEFTKTDLTNIRGARRTRWQNMIDWVKAHLTMAGLIAYEKRNGERYIVFHCSPKLVSQS